MSAKDPGLSSFSYSNKGTGLVCDPADIVGRITLVRLSSVK